MSGILALGCHLIFIPIPKKLKGSRIHISGQLIGAAMTILPIASYIFCFFNLRSFGPHYATAINLISYCATSTLVCLAYYVLMEQTNDKTYLTIHITTGLLYPFPLLIGLNCGSEFIIKHILIAFYTIFCILAIIHILTCLYFYRQRYLTFTDDISGIEGVEFKLIGRTIHVSMVLIIIGTLSAASSYYPMWLGLIFISIFISGTIYIYICYHRILYSNIDSLIADEDESVDSEVEEVEEVEEIVYFEETSTNTISDETRAHIKEYLQRWINKKEFLNPTTSINSVAQAVCTNRTYLSRYINSAYNCSFKTWITQLRIEESKRLMIKHPEMSISQIAMQTGFTSSTSFSHIFTRYEEITPSLWREDNLL
ncbi:MAG: helix-turn-helix transcriptional regulator [Rikenellaceae bacterium]